MLCKSAFLDIVHNDEINDAAFFKSFFCEVLQSVTYINVHVYVHCTCFILGHLHQDFIEIMEFNVMLIAHLLTFLIMTKLTMRRLLKKVFLRSIAVCNGQMVYCYLVYDVIFSSQMR